MQSRPKAFQLTVPGCKKHLKSVWLLCTFLYVLVYFLCVTQAKDTAVKIFDGEIMDLIYCIINMYYKECTPLDVYGLGKGVVPDLQL